METIDAEDGESFEAHVLTPRAGHGPCVVLLSDIYGFDQSTAATAERLTDLGYVVLAPDLFWRTDFTIDPDQCGPFGHNAALDRAKRWDPALGLSDLGQVFHRAHRLPELQGAVGVVGLGFGGTLSIRAAERFEPVCAVAYQGLHLADEGSRLERIDCPTMVHLWGADPAVPAEDLHMIQSAAKANSNVVMHLHAGAGPGFDPIVAEQDQAMGAWSETASFLYLHLGGPGLGA